MLDFAGWPLELTVGVLVAAAVVIGKLGTLLSRTADRLADMTGWGEALFGAVLLGGATSLPGIVTSVSTAYQNYPQLAVSNAVGGIAAQTTFLAVADIVYRQANLEHAAASLENLVQGVLLSILLTISIFAASAPAVSFWGVHPASLALVLIYGLGLRLVAQTGIASLWKPRKTKETRQDAPQEETSHLSLSRQWWIFAGLAVVVGTAGYLVAQSGIALAERTGLSESIVGGLLTALVTSMPELVTSIAAVRQGALTLAVGGIIGGNSFDVLFLAFSDVAYRQGSIYHTMANQQMLMVALALLLTGILLLGLLRREKSGIANIGFESFLVLVLYLGSFMLLYSAG